MLVKLIKLVYLVLSILIVFYLLLPDTKFPTPLPDSVQSQEAGDTEELNRRAYFTNFEREEVVEHFRNQFNITAAGVEIAAFRFNYPPEEAQVIIRDQTRSSYLEEVVNPLKTALFINGFVPKSLKDDINIDGVHWEQKVTIKFVESTPFVRLAVYIPALFLGWVLLSEYFAVFKGLRRSR